MNDGTGNTAVKRPAAVAAGAAIIALTSLWGGAGVIVAGLARAQVCRP